MIYIFKYIIENKILYNFFLYINRLLFIHIQYSYIYIYIHFLYRLFHSAYLLIINFGQELYFIFGF